MNLTELTHEEPTALDIFNFNLERMKLAVNSTSHVAPPDIKNIEEFNEWIDSLAS